MIGRLRAISLAVAATAALAAASGAGAAPKPLVKTANGWITALAMDGSNVAYGTQAYAPTNCFKVFSWNALSHAGLLLSGPRSGNCGSDEPDGERVVAVALAGPRVAWIRNITGNTEADDYLYTRLLGKEKRLLGPRHGRDERRPAEGRLDRRPRRLGQRAGGQRVEHRPHGHGDEGLARERRPHEREGGRDRQRHAHRRVGRPRPDRRSPQRRLGRDLLRRRVLLTAVTPPSVRSIALRKDFLVVLTKTSTLSIYNSHTGAFIRSWPVPAAAANLDVSQNIAVFSVWRKLYALQLTTGKLVVLAAEKRAIVAAQIEAPGVVFAYNTVKGLKDVGNLVFLPLSAVKTAVS